MTYFAGKMPKEFKLIDKRKKLLNAWLKPREGCEREMFKQVFYEIQEQDKEFIRLLKAKRNNGDFVHIRDIDKLTGY